MFNIDAKKASRQHRTKHKVSRLGTPYEKRTIHEKLNPERTVRFAVFALVSGVVLLICGMKKIREYKNAFENNPFKYEL